MNTVKKISLISVGILLLTILLPVSWLYQEQSGLGFQLPHWSVFPFLNTYLAYYLFWASFVLALIVMIVILVLIFYPKNALEIPLSDSSKGTLSLKSSAIEGLVRSLVTESGYMKESKVTSNLSKNKCHIKVEGKLLPTKDAVETSRLLQKQIEGELNQFLGLNHGVRLHVTVKDLRQTDSSRKTHTRVK